jgi:hypothetical protein
MVACEQPEAGSPDAVVDALTRLCRVAARSVPALGAGVSLSSAEGLLGVAAASDGASVALEQLQFTYGEGPCLDAFVTRRPALAPDLSVERMTRWPVYTPAAHQAGVRAVFAFPLQVGAARLGVMDVYRERPGPLTDEALADALAFADLAVDLLLDGQDRAVEGGLPPGLDAALDRSAEIYQAQGMIKTQLDVDLAEAMVRLRAHAYAHERTLVEVARDVVARRLTLERDH